MPYAYPHWPEWGASHAGDLRIHTVLGHQGPLLEVCGDDTAVIRCEPCIMIHVVPLPTREQSQAYYATQFYQQSKPDYIARYERDRPWWELTHRKILERVHAALPPLQTGEDAYALLDIGTGPGIALDVARTLGFRTYGLEPSAAVAEYVGQRGHQVMALTLDAYYDRTVHGRMHCIYLYEVLEHLPNPEDALLHCWDLLVPGGIVAVQVPNDYNPLQLEACETHGLPHWWIQPQEHLYYFTPKTLQLLVRRCGYDILSLRSTYALERFLCSNVPYVGNDVLGRLCHCMRTFLELTADKEGAWAAREALYEAQLADGIGRELVCIARKRKG